MKTLNWLFNLGAAATALASGAFVALGAPVGVALLALLVCILGHVVTRTE